MPCIIFQITLAQAAMTVNEYMENIKDSLKTQKTSVFASTKLQMKKFKKFLPNKRQIDYKNIIGFQKPM